MKTEKQLARETRKDLRDAAHLLGEDAGATRDSCTAGLQRWACPDCKRDEQGKCAAQRSYESRLLVANRLLFIARNRV